MTDANSDLESLRRINAEINAAEIAGAKETIAALLAPQLAFQRADPAKTVDDRETFLRKVPEKQGDRSMRIVEPIQLFGNRAVVQCVITQGGREYHNLRLFVRRDGTWKLLGWANEPL